MEDTMDNFDLVLFSLSTKELWNNSNWEFVGIHDIKPPMEELSVQNRLEVLRGYHGRVAEWKCKIKGQEWKIATLTENPDRTVVLSKNWG